jgi:hypothetical protein
MSSTVWAQRSGSGVGDAGVPAGLVTGVDVIVGDDRGGAPDAMGPMSRSPTHELSNSIMAASADIVAPRVALRG